MTVPKKREVRQSKANDYPPFDRIVYKIEETRVAGGYEAFCPELLITVFGDTSEKVRAVLRRQVSEYLEDCEKLNVLDETLVDAGFYFNGEVWMSAEVEPPGPPKMRFIGTPSQEDLDAIG